ncbi:AAA family ATPase [Pseudarthrobacter raffinosi]|uniref:AAA family ATPase n=1 Tax=Pseudarthrobacter raffinosi TaxID=2953651 RepID=UPI00208F6515|nr:AAA family ATPase [Pseudarthrobacter sp. MDT3-28]
MVLEKLERVTRTGENQWEARCPAHADNAPSLSLTTGYKRPVVVDCHAGCDYSSVVAALVGLGVDEGIARGESSALRVRLRAVPDQPSKPVLPPLMEEQEDHYLQWHDRFVARSKVPGSQEEAAWDFLTGERGLALGTIEHFKLGYIARSQTGRITFPVRVRGKLYNVRRYRPHATESKMISWEGQGSPALLYPLQVLQERPATVPVLFCEGEIDALLANQESKDLFVAITGTGGAKTPPPDLSSLKNRRVFIAYDCDSAGTAGAEKLRERLVAAGAVPFVLDLTRLGLSSDSREDISDYFLRHGGTAEKLTQAMERAAEAEDESAEDRRLARVEFAAENLRVQQEARLMVAAEGWRPPVTTGTLAEQLARDPEPTQWHWPGLMQVSWNVLVIAQAKAGKTTLALNFLRSLADGVQLFDKYQPDPLAEGRKIAWWNAELSESQAMDWVRDLGVSNAPSVVPLHTRGQRMPFTVPAIRDWTVGWLRENNVAFWIIDPMSALYTGDENSNSEVGAWLNAIDEIKLAAGVESVMLIHHTGRTDDDENLHARGASRLEGWADLPLIFVGQKQERRYLRTPSVGRDVEVNVGLDYVPVSRSLVAVDGASRTGDKKRALALAAADAIWALDEGKTFTATALQAELPGAKPEPKRAAIRLAVSEGWLAEEPGQRNSTLYSRGPVAPRTARLNGPKRE